MAYFRCGGGPIRQAGGSVILASNPTITLTRDNSNQITITWSKPSSEVTIDHYNVYIYKSDTAPTSLEQFTLVTSISNQLTYTVGGLSKKSTYYFVVTSVTKDNYENASIKNKKSITLYETGVDCLLIKTSDNNGIYYSSNGVDWNNIYVDAGRPYDISYSYGMGIFYTASSTPKFSKDGKTWSNITGLEQSIPDGTTGRALTTPITYPNSYYAMGFRTMGYDTVIVNSDGSCSSYDPHFGSSNIEQNTKFWSVAGSVMYVSSIGKGNVYFNGSTTHYVTGNSFVRAVELGSKYVIATNKSSTGYIYYTDVYASISDKLVLSVDGLVVDLCCGGDSSVVVSCSNSSYYSTDYGKTWSKITKGEGPYASTPVNCHVAYDSANDTFIAIEGSNVYMCPGYDLTQWQYRGAHKLSGTIKYIIGK